MEKTTIRVDGMSCHHCENAVVTAVQALPGVKKAKASHVKKNAVVQYDPAQVSLDAIHKAITEEGYEVVV